MIATTEAAEGQLAYTGRPSLDVVAERVEIVVEAATALTVVKKLLGEIVVPGIVVRLFVVPLTVVPLMMDETSELPPPPDEALMIAVLGLRVVAAIVVCSLVVPAKVVRGITDSEAPVVAILEAPNVVGLIVVPGMVVSLCVVPEIVVPGSID